MARITLFNLLQDGHSFVTFPRVRNLALQPWIYPASNVSFQTPTELVKLPTCKSCDLPQAVPLVIPVRQISVCSALRKDSVFVFDFWET